MDTIRFCKLKDDYGFLSNFAPYGFVLQGYLWKTNEHFYQANKFTPGGDQFMKIYRAPTPRQAATFGRDPSVPIKSNWEDVKLDVMYRGLTAKFSQNPEIKELLLRTGHSRLVEDATVHKDYFWGEVNGEGENHLGNLLMRLREEFRTA